MSCVNFGTVSAVSGSVHSAVGNAAGISNGNIYDETATVTVGDVLTPSAPKNGSDSATREQLTTESFYHEVLYWETDNWVIENGKLPYLSWYGEVEFDIEEEPV